MTARKASAPARTSGRRGSRVGEAVKPAPLDYVRAGSVEQAAGALAAADGEGKIIAGGQSPDDAVREGGFPAVTGGGRTLRGVGHEVKTKGAGVPAHGADHASGLLYRSLPARADRAAGGPGVPQQQLRPPAGNRGPDVDQQVRQGWQPDLLSDRREGARPSGRHRRLV